MRDLQTDAAKAYLRADMQAAAPCSSVQFRSGRCFSSRSPVQSHQRSFSMREVAHQSSFLDRSCLRHGGMPGGYLQGVHSKVCRSKAVASEGILLPCVPSSALRWGLSSERGGVAGGEICPGQQQNSRFKAGRFSAWPRPLAGVEICCEKARLLYGPGLWVKMGAKATGAWS